MVYKEFSVFIYNPQFQEYYNFDIFSARDVSKELFLTSLDYLS